MNNFEERLKSLRKELISYQNETTENILAWLNEAATDTNPEMPCSLRDLSRRIDVLRHRLVIISNIFGYRDSAAIMYSQYLDSFIVRYQRMSLSKIKNSLFKE